MESFPGKLTDDIQDEYQVRTFAMVLETCVITAEGPVIQHVKLLNVLSFSCICLKCSKCFDNKSALLVHVQTHWDRSEYHEHPNEKITESNEIQLGNASVDGETVSVTVKERSVIGIHDGSYVDSDDANDEGDDISADDDNGNYTDDGCDVMSGEICSAGNNITDQNYIRCAGAEISRTNTSNCGVVSTDINDTSGTGVSVGGTGESGVSDTDTRDIRAAGANIIWTDNGAVGSTDKDVQGEDNDDVGDDASNDRETTDICGADVVSVDDDNNRGDKADVPALDENNEDVPTPFHSETPFSSNSRGGRRRVTCKCSVCGQIFSCKAKLNMHWCQHNKKLDPSEGYKKRASKKSTIETESRSRPNEKPYRCTVCGKTFSKPSGLKRHGTVHARNNVYTCPVRVCREQFANDVERKAHIKTHTCVVGDITKYICPLCGTHAGNLNDLVRHTRIHTGEKPFKCTVCDKQFSQACSLKEHSFIHTKEKPWLCTVCGMSFCSTARLNRHTQMHSPEGGNTTGVSKSPEKQSLMCSICGKTLARFDGLKIHMAAHEGRSVTCSVCGKNFKHSTSLRRHVRTEHEGKWKTCDICGRLFQGNSLLKTHMERKHSVGKLFVCSLCGGEFPSRGCLVRHCYQEHQDERDIQ